MTHNLKWDELSRDDLICDYFDIAEDIPEMLELVEHYGERWNGISSEKQLSDRFDEDLADVVVEQYGRDDQCAIDQAFNDWTDMLCKEGEIHPEQYDKYTYVGKYAERT